MSEHTVLYLSRHGQTVWHAENRYAGPSDIDLTDVGRQQAQQLADWAGRQTLDSLYVSPIRRARETVAPVEAATGLTATVIEGLAETDFGIAEGRTLPDLRAESPLVVEAFEKDPVAGAFPGGEDPRVAAARGLAALTSIAAAEPGREVLVVAHNTLFRLVLCSILQIPLSTYRKVLPRLNNGTLTTLRATGDGFALLSYNAPLS